MKVIVGKMPGGRAIEVEVAEGSTVFDVIKTANLEQDLNEGFEARMNNQQTELSSVVSPNSIITLTSKIKGNTTEIATVTAVALSSKDTDSIAERFVVSVPTSIHNFINVPDVKEMILKYHSKKWDKALNAYCIIVYPEDLIITLPTQMVIYGDTVICADVTQSVNGGNYVVFADEAEAKKIASFDKIRALHYIEAHMPEAFQHENSRAKAAYIVGEPDASLAEKEAAAEDDNAQQGIDYEPHCGNKDGNPCCSLDECCEDCESDTCGGCHDCDECEDYCVECEDCMLPEDAITLRELVDMCARLSIDVTLNIPGMSLYNEACEKRR